MRLIITGEWKVSVSLFHGSNCLARHAYEEQKTLRLPWFESMHALCSAETTTGSHHDVKNGNTVREELEQRFRAQWEKVTKDSSKMKTYSAFSAGFKREAYLDLQTGIDRKLIARLRSSAHRFNVETGRHQTRTSARNKPLYEDKAWRQSCKFCCDEELELLLQLPFMEPNLVEDERHVLAVCPAYDHLRSELDEYTIEVLQAWDSRLPTLFDRPHLNMTGKFIRRVFETRFPKKRWENTTIQQRKEEESPD